MIIRPNDYGLFSPDTIEELFEYMGIDYADFAAEANAKRALKSADAYMQGAIGEAYPVNDPRAKEMIFIIASDFYDNRNYNNQNGLSSNARKLVADMELQLRMELRRTHGKNL